MVMKIEGGHLLLWGARYCEGVGSHVVRIFSTPEFHTGPGQRHRTDWNLLHSDTHTHTIEMYPDVRGQKYTYTQVSDLVYYCICLYGLWTEVHVMYLNLSGRR